MILEIHVSFSLCVLVENDLLVFEQVVKREDTCSILSQNSIADLTGLNKDSVSNTLPVSRHTN